ncbi:MAG: thiamine ABC transporter substrate binding subunit [Alphaproteobacteria bacterium]
MSAFAALAIAGSTPSAYGQTEPILTVYTYSSFSGEFGPGEAVKANFEEVCGCFLEWVETEDAGTLLARLILEGPNLNADIVLGLDTNLIAAARESGLFADHGLDLANLDLPVDWADPTFVPFDWGWFAFIYNSQAIDEPHDTLAEFLADPDGPTVIIQDPRTSSPGLGLLLWIKQVFGDEAEAAWTALAPRIVTVTRGWSEAYGLFLEGESDMVLSYTTSPAYHIAVEGETRYRSAIFDEGHMMQVEVAAIVASTDQLALAQDFLAFMIEDGFQSTIPEGNWMYPAVTPANGLPTAFSDLGIPSTSFLMPSDDVAANRRDWINEWLAALAP